MPVLENISVCATGRFGHGRVVVNVELREQGPMVPTVPTNVRLDFLWIFFAICLENDNMGLGWIHMCPKIVTFSTGGRTPKFK